MVLNQMAVGQTLIQMELLHYSGWYDQDGNPCPGSCPGGYLQEEWERCSLQYDPPYVVESNGKALCKIDSIGGNCDYKGTVK